MILNIVKNIWFLFISLLLISACCQKQTDSLEKLRSDLHKYISGNHGTIAVAFQDLKTGDTLFINEKIQMHAASTMKTPVMMEVFNQVSEGKFSLSDSLIIKNEFRSIVDSSLFSMDISEDSDDVVYKNMGKKMCIYDLVYQMITVSSNFATNILIEHVDATNVMELMKSIGANNILVLRGVEDLKAYELGLNNTTDAFDMFLVMKVIANKQIISSEACIKMKDVLLDQKFNNKIPFLLPSTIKVAHKTGSITNISHDAAIVYLDQEHLYILIVLTKDIESHEQAKEIIARISRMVYDAIS